MTYPRINIDLNKIEENSKILNEFCLSKGVDLMGVTKVFCGEERIAKQMSLAGLKYLADSRIENIKKYRNLNIEKVLLRLPMISQLEEVVKYCDISLNSNSHTIGFLDQLAKKYKKTHKVILMIDLGDLREGYFDMDDLYSDLDLIMNMDNIRLLGLGTNLTCYGGVLPTEDNLGMLFDIKNKIEENYNIKIDVLSGGNSSSLYLLDKDKKLSFNNLRLGESIVLGRETAFGKKIPGLNYDSFQLWVEIIEVKEKPSIPIGKIGRDAFGNKPEFKDKGSILRGICAIGKQDVSFEDLKPLDEEIEIIGSSSDHLILDLSKCRKEYVLGDKIGFNLSYGGILSLMTSEYVAKNYV